MPKISIFSSETSITPYSNVSIGKIKELIRGNVKEHTLKIINACKNADYKSEEYDKNKKKLPLYTISGTFSVKKDSALTESSGLACFDLDTSDKDVAFGLKQQIAADEYSHVVFDSVGIGFRIWVKIPLVKNGEEYKKYYNSYLKYLSEKYKISLNKKDVTHLDTSCSNISRGWFLSIDKDLYENENSKVWDKIIEEQQLPDLQSRIPTHNDYRKAMKPLDMIRSAVKGEKHDIILKASCLMANYSRLGYIDESEAKRLLFQEASIVAPNHTADSRTKKAINDAFEYISKQPLTKEEKLKVEKETSELEKEADILIRLGKIHFNIDDVYSEIEDKYKKGIARGYDVGFYTHKERYTVKMGGTTYIYGSPFSGKSYITFQFLINLSRAFGLKHAIMSSETGNPSDIFIELIQMYIGEDFYNDYNKQMSNEKVEEAKNFLRKHFIIIDSVEQNLTPNDFYEYVNTLERVYNVKIHCTVVDPFNELYHDIRDGQTQLYYERILGYIRKDAYKYDRHNFIVTHTIKSETEKTKGKKMFYPSTIQDVAGGQAFARKGLNMISVFRPPANEKDFIKEEDDRFFDINETYLLYQKIKPKQIGSVGVERLWYDMKTHRFYEKINGQIFYALEFSEEKYKENYEVPQQVYSNINFDDEPPPF